MSRRIRPSALLRSRWLSPLLLLALWEAACRSGLIPAHVLAPPSTVLVSAIEFVWAELTEAAFTRLIDNFGHWHEAHSSPDSPYTALRAAASACRAPESSAM